MRIRSVLGDALSDDASRGPGVFVDAGHRLVAALLRANSTSRDSALDLLTADALVTYAFEAASASPADIERTAASAMVQIAALGALAPTSSAAQ